MQLLNEIKIDLTILEIQMIRKLTGMKCIRNLGC